MFSTLHWGICVVECSHIYGCQSFAACENIKLLKTYLFVGTFERSAKIDFSGDSLCIFYNLRKLSPTNFVYETTPNFIPYSIHNIVIFFSSFIRTFLNLTQDCVKIKGVYAFKFRLMQMHRASHFFGMVFWAFQMQHDKSKDYDWR